MSAAKLQFNFQGLPYMPIKLKPVMQRYGIKQADWCRAVTQTSGVSLSLSAGAQLINWNTWPKATSQESIKKQTEDFLRERGVPDQDVLTIWDIDEKDEGRMQHPAGVHTGQYQRGQQVDLIDDLIGEPEMLSADARRHFSIFRSPFDEDVNSPEDVFISPDIRYVRESMYQTAKHGGLLAIIGESGSGKSTLRKDLYERIGKETEQIQMIFPRVVDKTRMTSGSICEAIIRDLQPEAKIPQSLESKARLVEKILKGSASAGNRHVVIIEEAHDMTIQMMKLLKRFYEIEDGFKKLLSIIMIGQPELATKLNEANYPEAREFIRRCQVVHLVPLDTNLESYLKFKFERVGTKVDDVLDPSAYDAIRRKLTASKAGRTLSYINPLLVNITITKAMNLASEIGEAKVTADIIMQL